MKAILFYTWAEFVAKLPVHRKTVDRWLATGKLTVQVFQPQGTGGRRYVAVEEAERVLRELSGARP